MTKNYYLILGVAASASSDEIKAAFRRRARELHPDTSGMESGPFLEAQEAYTVLSDPVQRREYDHQVLRKTRRPWRPPAEPLVPPGPAPEPFAAAAPASIFLDHGFAREFYHASFDDSFDPLFDRLWSDSM